jgi:hypothetical protein
MRKKEEVRVHGLIWCRQELIMMLFGSSVLVRNMSILAHGGGEEVLSTSTTYKNTLFFVIVEIDSTISTLELVIRIKQVEKK